MKPLRVLLVEDSLDDAELLTRELRRGPFAVELLRVETAAEMDAALRAAQNGQPWDVIISDYVLPSFTAPAALELAKTHGLDLPFIIVSGSIGEAIAVESMKAGAHDFLLKGQLSRLVPAIERELREAHARQERRKERAVSDHERERLLTELRRAVQARDEFISIASHELKTPITSIELQLELLRGHPEKLDAKLEVLERQVTRMVGLIDALLDVTQVLSVGMVLNKEQLDLADLIRQAEQRPRPRTGGHGVEVRLDLEPAVGDWDRLRLDTVVTNLLTNAFKYGEGKPVDVKLRQQGGVAVLRVEDRGIGISPESQARIFERFERAVPDKHYGGFGLGLWIARKIVEEHGGTIGVTSKPGNGSVFLVTLPLHDETSDVLAASGRRHRRAERSATEPA
jgi:signal transduction histidine kinase